MNPSQLIAARVAVIALIATVATQLVYIGLSSMGGTVNRDIIWAVEVLLFAVVAVAGFALISTRPIMGSAIGTFGVLNTMQAGIGLVMFGPLFEGGEALAPVAGAVLALAFLLYFAAKLAIGLGALTAGLLLYRHTGGGVRILGLLTAIAGGIAVVLNGLAIFPQTDLTYPAGGAGTVATLLLALALVPTGRADTRH
ncbi:hypothetical protein [Aurantiacibacter gangjinensis]|uniref:Uncharacterized protein n=1 Tax=Aurantiacibacter gangjinensis TaxID=502682 RepID=A0A0G9MMJ6_9SPHN|nr:hypothetical protein [Aurantiacibacter gangjinensis]APE27972.1 hypothetical protein BMF35_a1143 [Aurantiacibacter gangjinensis]KLE31915.1 hypothetical protein AAW01_10725 [Aurantiacibacter gangjinensis]